MPKPLEDFTPAPSLPKGRSYNCRPCGVERNREWVKNNPEKAKKKHRNQRLKQRYNIDLVRYDQMLEAQHGVCAVCKCPPPEGKFLHVDHDHETGKVRALLCEPCNCSLGKAQDDPVRLRGLADYVEFHKGKVS